ncbi:topoisomerase II-associated protein PAT1 [Crepidotus variabilis]|uniref:Topoisomerase II-associated protein PAT1 n=1 Tax=Crepidotus variabilis TaxID=179855 RepID=A0A9P6EBN9_9AGAR|nr:topoisomerase II-associated protein PAT1 [Crepidotus variabilis]
MAFFGLPERDLPISSIGERPGNIAEYTWGEESYDGLGDALQEGRDDLNDETFGSTGPVGKDFDFSSQAPPELQNDYQQPLRTQPRNATTASLESLWHDHSAFSVLPRSNGPSRAGERHRMSPAPTQTQSHRYASPSHIGHMTGHQSQIRARTLQEIESEMLLNAQRQREQERERQEQEREELLQLEIEQQRLLRQQELLQQERMREREHELQQLMLQEQQQLQQQLQRQRLLQQQQQQQLHSQHTPPPRMMPTSQSPRFLDQQRQLLLVQQQQHQEQQRRLQLEEQLRREELERQMLAMNLERTRVDSPLYNGRRTQASIPAEVQEAHFLQQAYERQLQQQHQQHRRQSSRSPANLNPQYMATLQQDRLQSQDLLLHQRIIAELAAHGELPIDMRNVSQADQEALRAEAMRKILETEKMEEKRRRKAAKIAHMARYNDLMTQSDKDFITRIQVSQLVTQDPYADDFYAQVYGAILRSRMGLQSQDERVLKFGSGGGVGLGLASKGGSRRPSAMQRMEQQVERIVNNARKREEEKSLHALHSLQGALGKTSGRSYKAAPRQLLQVDGAAASPTLSHANPTGHISKGPGETKGGAAEEAAKLGRAALGTAADTDNLVKKEPLTHRQTLVVLEELYDLVLRIEQLRRDQPPSEDDRENDEWKAEYDHLVDRLWNEIRVMVPLETSDPHPFISLLTPSKGKKILPRLTRHLTNQRLLTLLTLLVACFHQLDVVKQALILDDVHDTVERLEVERQTAAFLGSVMQSILPVVSTANLRLVTGLLGLLLDRSNIVAVAQTRPGLALLTLFLSRVEVIKQTIATTPDVSDSPTLEESQQWRMIFDHLFQLLAPHFLTLFPSVRMAHRVSNDMPLQTDAVDQPVWQFLAALALHGVSEQHHVLVASLREKILENVFSVNKGWVQDEEERQTKLANVNLFLHAVNLDSSQIAM